MRSRFANPGLTGVGNGRRWQPNCLHSTIANSLVLPMMARQRRSLSRGMLAALRRLQGWRALRIARTRHCQSMAHSGPTGFPVENGRKSKHLSRVPRHSGQPLIDWCGGKGHLGRLLALHWQSRRDNPGNRPRACVPMASDSPGGRGLSKISSRAMSCCRIPDCHRAGMQWRCMPAAICIARWSGGPPQVAWWPSTWRRAAITSESPAIMSRCPGRC